MAMMVLGTCLNVTFILALPLLYKTKPHGYICGIYVTEEKLIQQTPSVLY
jgi:hypothetical protein